MRRRSRLGLAAIAFVGASVASGCGGRSVRELASGVAPSGGAASVAGGASGSGGAAGDESGCLELPIALEPLAPAIEFLIDSSGSMRELWVDETTRWQFVREALVGTFSSLSAETAPGLVFYPNVQWSAGIEGQGDDFCLLTYEAASIAELSDAHRTELLDAVEKQPTLGATPTHDAYEYAISLLSEAERRAKVAVVLTDGAPTYATGCVGDGVTPVDGAPLADAARSAFVSNGVRTFVIGLSGAAENLSAMAFAGGTARAACDIESGEMCHFDGSATSSPAEFLRSSLASIEREASRCAFENPPRKEDAPLPSFKSFRLSSPAGELTTLQAVDPGEPCAEGIVHFRSLGLYVLCPETCSLVAENPDLVVEAAAECVDLGLPR